MPASPDASNGGSRELIAGSRAARSGAGAVLAAALVLGACAEAREPPRGRVLLVGIDGASPRVMDPLLRQGRLPELAALAREGVHGRLRAHLPLQSPRIWNSVATGKRPDKHGILGFVRSDADRRGDLYRSTDRRVHAIWNIASDAGLTVGVVNWWNSYPPEVIRGVMISDHALPGQSRERRLAHAAVREPDTAPIVYPESWRERVLAVLEGAAAGPARADPFAAAEGAPLPDWVRRDALERAAREDAQVTALALEVERALRPDLLLVLLSGIDRVSHWLWGNLEPPRLYPPHLRPAPEQRAAGRAALLGYYAHTDALLGSLLARYGGDDLVLVLSDHGFEAGVKFEALTGQHESESARDGVLFARGPGLPGGGRTAGPGGPPSVDDVTPSVLAWLGLPVASDMDGRPLAILAGRSGRIESYDTTPVPRLGAADSGAEPEMLDRLRELGYLE